MKKSDSKQGTSYLCVGIILLLGYLLIVIAVLFGSDGTKQSSVEITALRMQADTAKQSLVEVQRELNRLRTLRGSEPVILKKETPSAAVVLKDKDASPPAVRPGVIVLGMHRSGTSMLGGLLTKMGLKTGGPLIQPAPDNPKGFFERIDIVLQDDALMANQRVHYSHNTYLYDPLVGLKDILDNRDTKWFNEGRKGLDFLNNPASYPWMLKDPRLCITLRTWLPLLNFVPAVLFTYRHPMDVALSMSNRGFEKFKVNKGLRIWYSYNRRAIEQSHDLCRVVTSHRKTMQQPEVEMDRIYRELRGCGVEVPHAVTTADITSFVDISLQHGRSSLTKESICSEDLSQLMPPSTWPTNEADHIALYRECIRVYCAMEDGSAFSPAFKWSDKVKDD